MSDEPKDKAVHRGEPFRKYAIEAILMDLIAELRDAHPEHPYALQNGSFCGTCQTGWPCDSAGMAVRAEQRLMEVIDD